MGSFGAGRAAPAECGRRRQHIALAAVYGIELPVTRNCRPIANPVLRPRVEAVCRVAGDEPPTICTPAQLLGGDDDAGA